MNDSVARDLLVLWTGSFGQAVASALASDSRVLISPLTDSLLAEPRSHFAASVGLTVFVGNRPLRADLLRMDAFLWESGIAWTACELNDTRLLLGPNVLPGVSPCFRCCSSRYRAMSFDKSALDQETAFERHMALHPEVQVRGFTPSMAHMAVTYVRAMRSDCAGRAGLLREISLPDLSIRQGRAIALHGCRLCRPVHSNPVDRFTADLKAAIGML